MMIFSIPPLAVNTNDNLIKLHKRGRMLMTSYEVLRFQRLDLFTISLKEIGVYIRKAQMADAINTLINGDGGKNPCDIIKSYAFTDLIFDDLINLLGKFNRFDLNTMIASPKSAGYFFGINLIQEQLKYGDGKYTLPFGINLIVTNSIDNGIIPCFDKKCTLEMVEADGLNVDIDKLIDRQFERASITSTAGFSKIFNDSVKAIVLR